VLLSEFTKAWLLYLGLIFMLMVMYAPGGIASLIMMNLRVAAFGKLRTLWVSYLALGVTFLIVLLGAGAMIEMIYHLQLDSGVGRCGQVPWCDPACTRFEQLVWLAVCPVDGLRSVRGHPTAVQAPVGRDSDRD
jgi:hypothetical protein